MIDIGNTPEYFIGFALLLARVGGLMIFAPFWGSFAIARSIRVVLALVLCAVLYPVIGSQITLPSLDPVTVVLGLASEMAVGLMLGLAGQIFLAALQLAGTVMGFQMGFSLVNVIDPQTNVEISVLAVLYNLAAITLFLIMDAHIWFFQAMVDSYQIVPPLTASLSGQLFDEMLRISSGLFYLGVKLAMPIVVVGITVDVLLGIVGRAAPQIHILIAGLPLKVLVGFIMVTLTARALIPFFDHHLSDLHRDLYIILRTLAV
ncbi:MAG TPA: flagellar biosynthetic protein FliR [Acidobacteriota bacterium]|nr:flagellar biosynthetic protein FliR [Acidobacteriota bacterium]